MAITGQHAFFHTRIRTSPAYSAMIGLCRSSPYSVIGYYIAIITSWSCNQYKRAGAIARKTGGEKIRRESRRLDSIASELASMRIGLAIALQTRYNQNARFQVKLPVVVFYYLNTANQMKR